MAKRGRKPWIPNGVDIKKAHEYAANGARQEDIAVVLGICEDTLIQKRKQFIELNEAIKKGNAERNVRDSERIQEYIAKAGKLGLTALIFRLKSRGGWRDQVLVSGDKSAPIVTQEKGWKPTPKEKSEIVRIIKETFKPA